MAGSLGGDPGSQGGGGGERCRDHQGSDDDRTPGNEAAHDVLLAGGGGRDEGHITRSLGRVCWSSPYAACVQKKTATRSDYFK